MAYSQINTYQELSSSEQYDIIKSLDWYHDGLKIIIGSEDGVLSFWEQDEDDSFSEKYYTKIQSPINSICWVPRGLNEKNQVAIGLQSGQLQIFDVEDKNITHDNRPFETPVSKISYANQELYVLHSDGKFLRWQAPNSNKINYLERNGKVSTFEISNFSNEFLIYSKQNILTVFNTVSKNTISRIDTTSKSFLNLDDEIGEITNIKWINDNLNIITSHSTGQLILWNINKDKTDMEFESMIRDSELKPITSISLSPDSLILSCCTTDGHVEFWSTQNWVKIHSISELGIYTKKPFREIKFNPREPLISTIQR